MDFTFQKKYLRCSSGTGKAQKLFSVSSKGHNSELYNTL